MEKTYSNTFKQIATFLMIATTVIAGLVLLPFTDNFVYDTKSFGLFFATLAMFVVFVLQAYQRKSFNIVLAPYSGPMLLLGLAATLSSFFTNSYPVEHLLGFGGVYIAVALISVFGGSVLPKDSAMKLIKTLAVVGSLVTLTSVLEIVGAGPARMFNQAMGLNLPTTLLFNLSGSSFIATQLILLAVVGIVAHIYINKKADRFFVYTLPILIIGLLVHGWSLLPGKPAELRLPSLTASWSVALDSIREPRSALIGVGPAAYQNVYTRYKPLWVNDTPEWSLQFSQAANTPLTILTMMGFVGLIAWILLATKVFNQVKSADMNSKPIAVLATFAVLMQLLLPSNVVTLTIFAITIAVLSASQRSQLSVLQLGAMSAQVSGPRSLEQIYDQRDQKVINPFFLIAIILMVGVGVVGYMTSRAYAAYYNMNLSNRAAIENDAASAYQLQLKAVNQNPYLDSVRRRYALTNMLIAVAISNKADITEEEQTQVTQLLQQSIREARSATLLDPGDTQNWTVLAQIYQNIIPASEEAISWAVQSYVSAIETNPTDPSLRIALGSIFLGQEEYQQAAALFQQATEVKPDFANAHYNLAVALKQIGQLEAARTAYQRVLVLIDPSSDDYTVVTSELEELEGQIEQAQSQTAEETEETDSTAPSILNQNLEDGTNVIQNPSVQTDLSPQVQDTNEGPSPSPEASPQASPEAQ